MTQSSFPENDMEPEKSDSSEARFLALTKILSLEQDLGYKDTSVVGGIDQFLEKTIPYQMLNLMNRTSIKTLHISMSKLLCSFHHFCCFYNVIQTFYTVADST